MTFSAFSESELEKFILHHAKIAPGDKLEGKVIEVRADGKVLIDFKGFRALAETEIQVQANDMIRVVVVARLPKLRLRLEHSQKVSKDSVHPGARNAIKNMQQNDDRYGNNWVHVRGLLKQITGDANSVNLLLPAGVGEELDKGNRPVKFNISGDEPHTLSLLLDSSRLGRLRIDFQHRPEEKKLSITFYIKNPEAKIILESSAARIKENLEHRFQQFVLRVVYSPVRVGEFDTLYLQRQTGTTTVLDIDA